MRDTLVYFVFVLLQVACSIPWTTELPFPDETTPNEFWTTSSGGPDNTDWPLEGPFLATDRLVVEGHVHRDDKLVTLRDECADIGSASCSELGRQLCLSIEASLNAYSQLRGLYDGCSLWAENREKIVSTIKVQENFGRTTPLSLIQAALSQGKKHAHKGYAHYGEDVTVGVRLVAEGTVFKDGELMHVGVACADIHSADCRNLGYTLCSTTQDALEAVPELKGLFGGCALWRDRHNSIVSTITVDEKFTRKVTLSTIENALRRSKHIAKEHYAYYDEDVTVGAPSSTIEPPEPEWTTEFPLPGPTTEGSWTNVPGVTDTDWPLEGPFLATDRLVVEGRVFRDEELVSLKKECASVGSAACSELGRTLCTTMQAALNAYSQLHGMSKGCSLWTDNGDKIVSTIDIHENFGRTTPLSLIQAALSKSSKYAKKGYAHYAEDVTVGVRLAVEGKVYKDGELMHLAKECSDRHSINCYELGRTLCTTMQSALNAVPELRGLLGGCALWRDKLVSIVSTIDVKSDYKKIVALSTIQNALRKSKDFASAFDAYYGEDVIVATPGSTIEPSEADGPVDKLLEAGDKVVVEGRVFKDGKVWQIGTACADRHSIDCTELGRTLCTTMQTALDDSPKLRGLLGTCTLWRDNGDKVVSTITVSEKYTAVAHVDNIREVLKQTKRYANKGYAYYDEHVTVAAHPVEAGDVLVIDGTVIKDGKRLQLGTACEDRHSSECYELGRTLCTVIQSALETHPELHGLFGQCELWRDREGKIVSSLTVHENFDSAASVELIEEVLKQSKQLANKWYAYYEDDVKVEAHPIMPGYKLLIKGKVFKNGELMHVDNVCADRHSSDCYELVRTLCTTLKSSLEAHSHLKGLFGTCALWHDDGDNLVSTLTANEKYNGLAPFFKVKEALKQSRFYANRWYAYYDEGLRVKLEKPKPDSGVTGTYPDEMTTPNHWPGYGNSGEFNLIGSQKGSANQKWKRLNFLSAAAAVVLLLPAV